MKIYINGTYYERHEAKVSVFDHGFLYGDGIFEGIRVYEGCVFKLDEHLKRLEYSAKAIMLDLPWTRAEISEAVCESCRQNGVTDGYIRLIVTRGAGALGLSPKSCSDPQMIIIADQIELYPPEIYQKGLKVITSATRRNSPAALPPMVKSLNYLNNIMAKIEAGNLGYAEAIMLNNEGYVAECTGDNLFVLQGGKLFTPPVASGSLTGITREAVLEIAADLDVPVVESLLTRYDLWVAEEMFLTGSAAEIIGVIEVDHRKIGDGTPGPVTQRFLEAFRARVTQDGTML
ncbi:branched-chain-amino-acid transaminase [Ruficoccus sp. ZRK36]|uniref:branched-chain-amino-acid transaminase n=1 Tax=Ruficoccus sp. ZRK36 TaxID=2866311 RepID=UPI001C72C68C|nr:branched-chain-amino-acid transaminase [Ruficoccus sp. ZRK36]QYY36399.1 branched-chain-amino-acid transaminase [Ruficoccus sp. ZRK36]